jgi:hypothetical protein
MESNAATIFSRHWLRLVLLFWLCVSAWMLVDRWDSIHWFALGDTDDNLRMQQVRDWLHGQGWYDLRQYRLDPPAGADIHWSRIVDLPIAAILLILRPFLGGILAEQAAVAIAPLLPMAVLMVAVAVAVRRLVAPQAWVFALPAMLFCPSLLGMFKPLRIDHHGWQLAMVAIVVAGLADEKRARGGVTIGLASALSLSIGLEMVPYLAIAGGAVVLHWVFGKHEAPRFSAYALSLSGGAAIGFTLFASEANRAPRCDALSPVWLSAVVAAGALLYLLSRMTTRNPWIRLATAGAAGGVLAAGFVLAWPICLNGLEGLTPETKELWFNHIREVKPITTQSIELMVTLGVSASVGLIGSVWATLRERGSDRFGSWATILLMCVASSGMLLWQTRAGPTVQLVAIPGATALAWAILPKLRGSSSVLVRVLGTIVAFAVFSGMAAQLGVALKPKQAQPKISQTSTRANAQCSTGPSLSPIAHQPKGIVFTFVDLSPRLIVMTKHSAIAGPYHRNQQAIVDIHRAFRGQPEAARAIIDRHHADYVLICPGSSESTIFMAAARNGFYGQLAKGQAPDWLERVTLPERSPFMMWRIKRPAS